MLQKVIIAVLIILVLFLALALVAKTPAGEEFLATNFNLALPGIEIESDETVTAEEESEGESTGESDSTAESDGQPAGGEADSGPGDADSAGGAMPAPDESSSAAEAPADSGGSDMAEPVPAPRPEEPAPPAEPAIPPSPAEPVPPAPPDPGDPEDGVTSDPLEPPAPGGSGSFSIAPYDPGSGVVFAPIPLRMVLRAIRPECGFIVMDHSVYTNTYVYAGDDPYNRFNRGFISFDISDLAGATITKVTLRMANPIIRGNPALFHRTRQGLEIIAMDWHSNTLQRADYHRIGTRVGTYQNYDITLQSVAGGSYPVLAEQLQLRINNRSNRFRLRLQWANETTNNNDQEDGVRYLHPQNDIMLTVEYTR